MAHEGPDFYDDPSVFATYTRHRETSDNPNDTIELPIIVELLSDVRGLDVLDLGCGHAAFGRQLLASGAASYLGVDGSKNMVAAATNNLNGTLGRVVQADIRTWSFPRNAFDCAVSRLVLHYVDDLKAIVAKTHEALRPGGRFVFSVEHPVITSCDKVWGGDGLRQHWLVDDYFVTGKRVTKWLGGEVVKFHRTVEDYFRTLQAAGFIVQEVREPRPERRYLNDDATFARRQRIPLFLLMAAQKS